jgi:hypothetical protein
MPEIILSNEGSSNFQLIPAGNYIARCYSMVHIGTIEEEYQGQKKMLNKVQLRWETPEEKAVFSQEKGEQPFSVSKEFTCSLHEKSTLRKFLESWRGKGFTEEEARRFDLSKLLGAACMVNVIHKVSASGNKRAEISGISAMPKGFKCPEPINPPLIFTIQQPDWDVFETLTEFVKEKIKKSKEYQILKDPTNSVSEPSHMEDDDSGLPF